MHARHLHRLLGDQHLLAQRLGETAHDELRRTIGALTGYAIAPNGLEMLTMWPSPDAITCGRKALVPAVEPAMVDAVGEPVAAQAVSCPC
jgi:hypothetical protein